MTKKELFITLAKPNKNGISRWVSVSEFGSGNSIYTVRLNGFNIKTYFNQNIRADIKDFYANSTNKRILY